MRKKLLKYTFVTVIIIVLLRFLFSFELVKTADRGGNVYPLSADLKEQIAKETKGFTEKEIITYSTKLTARMLRFTKTNDIEAGKANCVGYAKLCAAICQHGFNANKIKGRAKPVVGDVRKFGVSICKMLKSIVSSSWEGFVKDHDFVEVQLPNKTVYFDACLYDYTFNNCKTTIAKKQ